MRKQGCDPSWKGDGHFPEPCLDVLTYVKYLQVTRNNDS